MKVKYIYHTGNKGSSLFHNFLLDCFKCMPFSVEISEIKNRNLKNSLVSTEDIIILFGISPKHLKRRLVDKPLIIYFDLLSKYYFTGIPYFQVIDCCVMFNDTPLNHPIRSISPEIASIVNPVLIPKNTSRQSSNKHEVLITLKFEESFTMNSLAGCYRFANNLNNRFRDHCSISILTNIPGSVNFVNKSIKVIYKKNEADFNNELLRQLLLADTYYGSGYQTSLALFVCPNVFVLGERGYGGRVNLENFYDNLKSMFLGRVGGEIGEYVPNKLVLDEFIANMNRKNMDETTSRNEKKFYLKCRQESMQSVIDLVLSTYNNSIIFEERFESLPLRFSKLYSIHLDGPIILVRNSLTNKIEYHLDSSIYSLLSKCGEEFTPSSLIAQFGNEASIRQILKTLYNMKIIVFKYSHYA